MIDSQTKGKGGWQRRLANGQETSCTLLALQTGIIPSRAVPGFAISWMGGLMYNPGLIRATTVITGSLMSKAPGYVWSLTVIMALASVVIYLVTSSSQSSQLITAQQQQQPVVPVSNNALTTTPNSTRLAHHTSCDSRRSSTSTQCTVWVAAAARRSAHMAEWATCHAMPCHAWLTTLTCPYSSVVFGPDWQCGGIHILYCWISWACCAVLCWCH